jgi:uncharacterized protein involved in outer membrane biogenesis
LIAVVAAIVLLFIGYFVVTSSAFFKGVILPRVGKALNAEITVAEASISPFSQVSLRQLQVKTTGAEPLLKADEVRLRYRLLSILRGHLVVDEVTVASPVIHITRAADGTSNLDPLLQTPTASAPAPKAPPTQPGPPPQMAVKAVALKDATVRMVTLLKGSDRQMFELSKINVTLDQLVNGRPGKLTLGAELRLDQVAGTNQSELSSRAAGAFDFQLGPDLKPQSVKGNLTHEVTRATSSFGELASQRAVFDCELTATEVKQLALRFFKGATALGELGVSGPLDLAKQEGRLTLKVGPIDRQVLNTFGAPFGLEFGPTRLDALAQLDLTRTGSLITLSGRFNASPFAFSLEGKSPPPLDLHAGFSVTVEPKAESARLQTLTLEGTQNRRPLLRGELSRPVAVSWARDQVAVAGDAVLQLTVTDLGLADWQAFTGDTLAGGKLDLGLSLTAQPDGRRLMIEATSHLRELAVRTGTNAQDRLDRLDIQGQMSVQLDDFNAVKIVRSSLELAQSNRPLAALETTASYLVTNALLNLETCRVKLPATTRAANVLTLAGRVDLSKTNGSGGELTLRSDALDLTTYYDQFAAAPVATNAPTTTQPPSTPPPSPPSEPDPITLPVEQFTFDTRIAALYLREMVCSNVVAKVRITPHEVLIQPFELAMNGAPVRSDVALNLGVKGWAYEVGFKADKVPLEPIANSFSPTTRGQYQGLLLSDTRIKGAGITGPNLKKNLSGQLHFSFTNANIQVLSPKSKRLLTPIATLLRIKDINQSPLNWVWTELELGKEKATLTRLTLQSIAFEADTKGVIPLADALEQSPLNLPIEFRLRRSLAEKSDLLPANAPTNAQYVKLPDFLTVKGTLAEPQSDLKETALGGLLLKSGVGIAEKLGVKLDDKTGNLLKGAGNLLTGEKSSGTSTNQGATTNQMLNPLDLFRKKPAK